MGNEPSGTGVVGSAPFVEQKYLSREPSEPFKSSLYVLALPRLTSQQSSLLKTMKPFDEELKQDHRFEKVTVSTGVYYGEVAAEDGVTPEGLGKLHSKNGLFWIGHFRKGKINGPSLVVWPDGSYYRGDIVDGVANCQEGIYVNPLKAITYKGGFKGNNFEGKGTLDFQGGRPILTGHFAQGCLTDGEMRWKEKNFNAVYKGSFDIEGKFHGQGELTNQNGVYKGQFVNGVKHGKGVFMFNSNYHFEGSYLNGERSGYGSLYDPQSKVVYSGAWVKGQPLSSEPEKKNSQIKESAK